jgi:hypothetical protein
MDTVMPLYDFACKTCRIHFEAFSFYVEGEGIRSVACVQCSEPASSIWLKAPATKFDSAHDWPVELRDAAKVQLGREFSTRKEHDDYCKENGWVPLTRREFEQVATSRPETPTAIVDQDKLERRINESVEKNFNKLLNGDLPPQPQVAPEHVAEIKETAEKIQKQIGG